MKRDSLGDRMKGYESVPSFKLTRRTPVIVRIDGKAFHSYTKKIKAKKPFDEDLMYLMTETALFLASNISGCKFVYTQSDEISLLITDYETVNTEAWFDNKLQKIVSVAASMATAKFNSISDLYFKGSPLAMFDARAFNIPREDVANYFIWRQNDASRNSVQMLARSLFSHKQCEGKSGSQLQDMMMETHKVNWNDLSTDKKRGTAIYKHLDDSILFWKIDKNIPIFTQDHFFIDKWLIAKPVEELLKNIQAAEAGVFT